MPLRKTEKSQSNKTGKIALQRTTRIIILCLITGILLMSLFAVLMAYQTPATTSETTTVAHYTQTGSYTYRVYLKNNTLYDASFLLPGQGEYFKQIIDGINASITYTYQSNRSGGINGNYSIDAEIKTDLWTKKYPLTEPTPFSSNNQTATITQQFLVNSSFYDQIVGQINTETGVIAPNPLLIIHTNIILSQATDQGTIHAQLSPELSMTLTQKTLDISENLTSSKTGALSRQTTQYHEAVIMQKNIFTVVAVSVAIILCAVLMFTKSKPDEKNETERTIKRIYKKNGDWIVKTLTPPPTALQHLLRLASIEDIIKIGEDLNKPLFHYIRQNPPRHLFYILDATTTYLYEISTEENTEQDAPLIL
jgi:hypothetical protein